MVELISQLSIYDYFINDLQSELMTVAMFDFSSKKQKMRCLTFLHVDEHKNICDRTLRFKLILRNNFATALRVQVCPTLFHPWSNFKIYGNKLAAMIKQ